MSSCKAKTLYVPYKRYFLKAMGAFTLGYKVWHLQFCLWPSWYVDRHSKGAIDGFKTKVANDGRGVYLYELRCMGLKVQTLRD